MGRTKDESTKENEYAVSASWLQQADWNLFLTHLGPKLLEHDREHNSTWDQKLSLLNQYKEVFQAPWTTALFNSIENRRMLLGTGDHAWLGHVGASGHFRHLLAKGDIESKRTIVNAMNAIFRLPLPIQWDRLQRQLEKLVQLGPTMKVWSRLLTIARPDIYGTIAATTVRNNLANLLDVPDSYFATVDGYIYFLRQIHNAPWFNSPEPRDDFERAVWENRVALLDTIFY